MCSGSKKGPSSSYSFYPRSSGLGEESCPLPKPWKSCLDFCLSHVNKQEGGWRRVSIGALSWSHRTAPPILSATVTTGAEGGKKQRMLVSLSELPCWLLREKPGRKGFSFPLFPIVLNSQTDGQPYCEFSPLGENLLSPRSHLFPQNIFYDPLLSSWNQWDYKSSDIQLKQMN